MDIRSLIPRPDLETNGKWFAFEDAEFLIASSMNPKHKKKLGRLGVGKYEKAVRTRDPEGWEKMNIEAMADTILLDWRGNVTDGTNVLVYSRDNAIRLLGIQAFREWVSEKANNVSNFVAEEEQAQQGELKSGDQVGPAVG